MFLYTFDVDKQPNLVENYEFDKTSKSPMEEDSVGINIFTKPHNNDWQQNYSSNRNIPFIRNKNNLNFGNNERI